MERDIKGKKTEDMLKKAHKYKRTPLTLVCVRAPFASSDSSVWSNSLTETKDNVLSTTW